MTRDEFLTQISVKMSRYPAAPEDCCSLWRWNETPGWVAGPILEAGGEHLLLGTPLCRLEVDCRSGLPLRQGDHVAVRLERRENRWAADELVFLVPAIEPVSSAGRSDWRPFVHTIHAFFHARGFTEIETPGLVTCPGLEPALEPFASEFRFGSRSEKRFLPTSPEIHLKKALCLGWTDIYEIKPCYRNGEISEHHQPEFLMLEWYRAYAGLDMMIDDLRELLKFIGAPAPRVTTFATLFDEKLGLRLTPATTAMELRDWCRSLNIAFDPSDTGTDLFHRIWLEKLEPEIRGTMIVRDFPPDQAALARIKSDGWADRFELYWDGVEIANAFHEVNDPEEQKRRWARESEERRRLGRTPLDGDAQLIELMIRHGLPPSGGIALGLERLFMMSRGVRDIRGLRPFPYR